MDIMSFFTALHLDICMQCRMKRMSYKGVLQARIDIHIDKKAVFSSEKAIGEVPILVKVGFR